MRPSLGVEQGGRAGHSSELDAKLDTGVAVAAASAEWSHFLPGHRFLPLPPPIVSRET